MQRSSGSKTATVLFAIRSVCALMRERDKPFATLDTHEQRGLRIVRFRESAVPEEGGGKPKTVVALKDCNRFQF
jgi:hypothetical protein